MDTRHLVSLVAQRKSTWAAGQRYAHYTCAALNDEWEKNRGLPGFAGDIYPVRGVSVLEVFTRSWVCAMVDGSNIIAERAIALVQNAKPDYRLVLSITDKTITFGDIVAHTVPVSGLDHIMSIFRTLCDKDLRPLLESVVDRWEVEIENKPAISIVGDYDAVCADVARLFELRHMVCHEAPRLGTAAAWTLGNLGSLLKSLTMLVHALEEVLTNELFGKPPLTQLAMNAKALSDYEETCKSMNDVLGQLRDLYKANERQLRLLNITQSAWERYSRLQSTFRHDPATGGTIGPMVRAFEAMELTQERTERLRRFLNAEEGWV